MEEKIKAGWQILRQGFNEGDADKVKEKYDKEALGVLNTLFFPSFWVTNIISALFLIYLMKNKITCPKSKELFMSGSLWLSILSSGIMPKATSIVVLSSSDINIPLYKSSWEQILSISSMKMYAESACWSWLMLVFFNIL